jgi:hypothetical protein
MSQLAKSLKGLNSAEELLSFFRVPFDRRLLDVHRMRILRRAGTLLDESLAAEEDDDLIYERMRRMLFEAYAEAARAETERGGDPAPPVARPPGSAFVPLDAIAGLPPSVRRSRS